MIVFLDTNMLGSVVNPTVKSASVQAIKRWAQEMQDAGHQLAVPAIADYEVRRELHRRHAQKSIAALDTFNNEVPGRYLPVEETALRLAAVLWGRVRNEGKPTADSKALDGDVILAAQVIGAGVRRGSVCGRHRQCDPPGIICEREKVAGNRPMTDTFWTQGLPRARLVPRNG